MKKSIEKGIKDSGYNIKEETNKLEDVKEFYNKFGKDFDWNATASTNFLLWKILKKLEAKK